MALTSRSSGAARVALGLVRLPGAVAEIGSDDHEIDECVHRWLPTLRDPADRPHFRSWIEKEYPRHRVAIEPFLLGRYPVQNGEYAAFVDATNHAAPASLERGEPNDHPVWGVSYEDAARYARWVGEAIGLVVRLPTEAEWEYAARGPQRKQYPWGDTFDPQRCNTEEAKIGTTTPVTRYPEGRSDFDIWDLAGNVEEWTSSFYGPYPGGRFVEDDFARAAKGRYRVLRGGNCRLGGDLARGARRHGPSSRGDYRYVGFRLAADAPPDEGAAP